MYLVYPSVPIAESLLEAVNDPKQFLGRTEQTGFARFGSKPVT
jgi:hypothetical protein